MILSFHQLDDQIFELITGLSFFKGSFGQTAAQISPRLIIPHHHGIDKRVQNWTNHFH
jgi:hypothetical protein